MTPARREILRVLYATDNAKYAADHFGVSESYINRVRREERDRLPVACRTDYELARRVMRRAPRHDGISVPIWNLSET